MSWKYGLGLLMSALFLFLAFRAVDPAELAGSLERAHYGYMIPVVALMMFSVWARAVRWRYLLAPVKIIGIKSLFFATAIGLMANDLLPARIGEVMRAHVIGERESISRSASLATIVVERLFDGFTLLLFLAVVLLAGGVSVPGWLHGAALATIALYVAVLAGLVFFGARSGFVVGIGERIARPLPERARISIARLLRSFAGGLAILKSSRNMVIAALLSLLVWLPNAAMIHLLLLSFGIHLPAAVSFLLLVALCVGVMIPSAPGFIGTIQYVSVSVLGLFGIARGEALSFSLVYHACIYVPVVVTGLVCLAIEGVSFRDLNVLARRREGEPESESVEPASQRRMRTNNERSGE